MEQKKIIQQGAEALIILEKDEIIKKRVKKSYRISELDEKIRKRRTRAEGKLLEKASKVIAIPKIKKVDETNKEIIMEFLQGKKLSEHLDHFNLEKQKKIFNEIGSSVSKIHNQEIIHGDLTTSNMILFKNKIFFIDFGLGFISHKIEDKAVDLHLLRQALESRHFKNGETLFQEFIQGYKKQKEYEKVIQQLKKVESRGRYKEKY